MKNISPFLFLRFAIEKKMENLDENRNESISVKIFSLAMSNKTFLVYYLKYFICLSSLEKCKSGNSQTDIF